MARTIFTPYASFTRPADTNAYAAGDGINNSTSAPTILTFDPCVPYPDGSGLITTATLTDSLVAATALDGELWLFTASPTVPNDNAAFTPTDAQMEDSFVGVIPFATASRYDAAINSGYVATDLNIGFKCGSGLRALYGMLVARNAFTPGSGEKFKIGLTILVDW